MTLSHSHKTKGQVWSLDILVAFVILLLGIIFFYYQNPLESGIPKSDTETLTLYAKSISGFLISAGFPANWTPENVTLVGLTDGNTRLSQTKVHYYSSLDYKRTKNILSTTRDYQISFRDRMNSPLSIGNITSLGKNFSAENPENVVTLTRYIFYNGSIIQMVVHVW